MPLTVCEPFGGNAARSGDVGQGGSREAGRGRRRYSDRRTEFGAPEGGRLLSPGIGINGERPTPSGGRAGEERYATARTRRRHDRRRDSADCGAGLPARSPRDHIVQISSENPGTASRLWDACAPPESKRVLGKDNLNPQELRDGQKYDITCRSPW